MFNVIEPQEHQVYESTINLFLQELHDADLLDAVSLEQDQDLTNATYILLEEELKGLQGGALLLKQPLQDVVPAVRTYLENLCPQYTHQYEIWTGKIAFQISKDISGRDYEIISKLLYHTLYDDLIAFSVKENAPFLCLTLPLVEHLSINMLGLWDFMFEIRPGESNDGFFHGLLSLAGAAQVSSSPQKVLQNCN